MPTVDIFGKQVPVSEIVPHFDPACERRCDEGTVRVFRPMPKPFKGTMPVREVCECAVRRYIAEHPPEVQGGLSAGAAAVLRDVARGPRTNAGPKNAEKNAKEKLQRLGAELSRETTRLLTLRAANADKVAPLTAELTACIDTIIAADPAGATRAQRRADAEKREEECIRALNAVRSLLVDLEREESEAVSSTAGAERRQDELKKQIEELTKAAQVAEAPLLKAIEKLERRISNVLLFHPEARDG